MSESSSTAGQGQASGDGAQSVNNSGENTAVNQNQEAAPNAEGSEEAKESYEAQWRKSIREGHPDDKFGDDDNEAFFERSVKRRAKLKGEHADLTSYKERNSKVNEGLMNAFRSHPELMSAVKDVVDGSDVPEAFARHYDTATWERPEGDPNREKWTKANQERISKLKESDAAKAETQKNFEASVPVLTKFIADNEMNDDDASKYVNSFVETVEAVLAGKLTEGILKRHHKAMSFDDVVADTEKRAKVEGLNENIEVIKEKEDTEKGDGLPQIDASNKEQDGNKKQSDTDKFWGGAMDDVIKKDKEMQM